MTAPVGWRPACWRVCNLTGFFLGGRRGRVVAGERRGVWSGACKARELHAYTTGVLATWNGSEWTIATVCTCTVPPGTPIGRHQSWCDLRLGNEQ